MPISTNSEKKDPQLCIIRSGASNVINRNKQKENGKLRKIRKGICLKYSYTVLEAPLPRISLYCKKKKNHKTASKNMIIRKRERERERA